MLLAHGRHWRITLARKKQAALLVLADLPASDAELEGFEAEVPLARWNAVVRNAESDRKLLGGVLLDGATAKDRVARVVGSEPILCDLQRVERHATRARGETGGVQKTPPEEGP
jgi:hypothetical protein